MSILNDISEQPATTSGSDDSDDFHIILDSFTAHVNLIGYKTLDSRLFDLKTSWPDGSSTSFIGLNGHVSEDLGQVAYFVGDGQERLVWRLRRVFP